MGSGTRAEIRAAHAWFRDWMFGCALPFWAEAGHEGPGRGACEFLALDGSPGGAEFKRMRVQARQLYVFSQAALLGWDKGARLARETYGFMLRGERADGGWVRRLSPDGARVLDSAVDLYDQAFVLFALAWFARLGDGAEPALRARRTVAWLQTHMALPQGGFHNAMPPESGPRQQNPHMHLLEAALAWHETSGDEAYARLAHDLVALFRQKLFDPNTGTLGEVFDPDWAPLAGAPVEPGHHFEWVWLLDAYDRQTGLAAGDEIARLYQFASVHGTEPQTGLAWDAVSREGHPVRASARLWPQTEALKAHAALTRRGQDRSGAIAAVLANLRGRYLRGCPSGAWIDQLSDRFQPVSASIPTSSFYHLMMAYTELDALMASQG